MGQDRFETPYGSVYWEDDRPPTRPWTRWVWINFAASLWVLVARSGYEAVRFATQYEEKAPRYVWEPFYLRELTWPLGVAAVALTVWWLVVRRGEPGARISAVLIGLLMLQPVVGAPVAADTYGVPMDVWPWAIYTYVLVSQVAYAILGREA